MAMKKLLLLGLALALALSFPLPSRAQIGSFSACAANTLSVSGTSSNVALSQCGPVVILMNITSQEAFWTFGSTSGATATTAANTTASYSIPGNSFLRVTIPNLQNNWFAAITATSTTTIRIIQGMQQ